jgi:hypothetical protein
MCKTPDEMKQSRTTAIVNYSSFTASIKRQQWLKSMLSEVIQLVKLRALDN